MADNGEQLSIVVEHHEGRVLVRLEGELDLVTAPSLEATLNQANSEIVVDLAGLAFLDARGLDALGAASARAERHGDRLTVINANSLMQRMFEVTGLDRLLSATDAV